MKHIKHSLFLFVFISVTTTWWQHAQAQYANAWINYSQQYFKIKVAQDGMYRVDYNALQAAGVPVSSINGNHYQLFSRGNSIPVYASSTNPFSSTDYLEFYGLRNDGSTETAVYNNPAHQANDKVSMFNDTTAYFLTWSSTINPDIITDYSNVINNPPAAENYCWYTSTVFYGAQRTTTQYIHGQPEIQGQQIWDSDFSNAEGYIDIAFNHTTVTKVLPTPYAYIAGPTATFKAQWCGKFPTQHYMETSFGGQLLSVRNYFGFFTQRLDTLIPTNSLISTPTTNITFSSVNNPNTTTDYNGIANIQLTYPRQFNFDNNSVTVFKLPAASGERYLTITNFNTNGSEVLLYDLTNKLRLIAVQGGLDTLKFLLPDASGERNLVIVANAPTVITSVANVKPVTFTNFGTPSNQGNFIIVANKYFNDDGNGNNYVEEYKQLKVSHGYQAVVVDMDEVYDQFGYGIDLSPLCLRNFTDYILGTWTSVSGEKNMLLIGKGIEFYFFNSDPTLKQLCYVPTWGYPGSDILLTAQINNQIPSINIGRLSITLHQELSNYKDKVEDFVAAQNMPQTIEDKAWMKNVIHLAGGENENDQYVFQYILNLYATMIEDSVYFGGDATLFSKNSSDPITVAQSAQMDSLISNGVSLITFFGHSSYQSLDFNLNDPYNYHNDGKYPLILTNGCLVGNLFSTDDGLGGEFTFAQDRGCIGFLAPSSFSVSNSLQLYTDNFYRNFTKDNYNATIGKLVTETVSDAINYSGNNVDRMVAEQMLYQGDPSLRLNTFDEPDYVIETPSVYFTPTNITAGLDSFTINVIVTNIGKAIDDSIFIDITRIFPSGDQSLVVHDLVKASYFVDTFSYKIDNPTLVSLGLNQFNIKVDAEDDVDELSELNNELTNSIIIQSNDIIPIYPYDFSIVNQSALTLKASTVDPFVQQGHYIFQIDTTENFNSPLLHTTNIISNGGVVTWNPNLTMTDSTVYYWRTSVDTIGNLEISWHGSSFVYLPNSSTGWNQSHYFQFKHNRYVNIELNDDRTFTYVDDIKTIGAYNGVTNYYAGPLNWDEIGFYMNGTRLAKWTCGTGVNWLIAVIDSATGIQWESEPQGNNLGQYGNIHCNNSWNYNAFYFNTSDPANFQTLINFIDTIPQGNYVLAMSINDPVYANFSPELEAAFATIGAQNIDTITTIRPYVLFSKKGDASYPVYEIVGNGLNDIIDTSFQIVGSWETGFIESAQVGPAQQWQSLHWNLNEVESLDEVQLKVIGIKADGTSEVVIPNVVSTDTSISGINALVYPYLKLRITLTDTLNSTPQQLDYWRINYSPEGELAIDPNSLFVMSDTVNKFSNFELSYAIANVSPVPMYNVPVKYIITDAANAPHIVMSTLDTVPAFDTIHAHLTYNINSSAYSGLNKVLIEINPFDANHVNEQYHFNNYATKSFIGTQDNVNPFLDVTFDGMHILDGEIVSAKPEIFIRLKDDNATLKLDDTSAFDISLKYPDGTTHQVVFDNLTAIFTAATASNNVATALFKPELIQDGTYQLIVQGYDKSGNPAGQYAYRIGFEVINKPMISNVLNYPNPFTTQTRFVFTLTGSKVPEFFKIQILTVTGKVVKEIYKEELGNIHIGNNMTEYAWDGTDQYGDELANGLYLYRVVTRLDNAAIERYETSVDRMFEKGFGKMYLMR